MCAREKCSYLNPNMTPRTENIASQLQLGTSFASPTGAAKMEVFLIVDWKAYFLVKEKHHPLQQTNGDIELITSILDVKVSLEDYIHPHMDGEIGALWLETCLWSH